MAIQINEFEILVDEPPASQPRGVTEPDAPAPQASAKVRPEEILSTARVNRERMERLRAD